MKRFNLRVVVESLMAFTRAMKAVGEAALTVGDLREQWNDEVFVAGLEARYFVRAGMDPEWATEQQLHEGITSILRLPLLTADNRAKVAAAALRGWPGRDGDVRDPETLAWHRLLGGIKVEVGRAQ